MSEMARRWGPETAASEPSIEHLLEPIALEARLAEARARRSQVLAAKLGNPAVVAGAAPAAAKAHVLEVPAFLIGLAAGAAALGFSWIINPLAIAPMVASAPPVVAMMWPDVPFRPADLLSFPRPMATGRSLSGSPPTSGGVQHAPVLWPPGRAVDATPRDDGLRPRSRARAGLMESLGPPWILVSERVRRSAFPEPPIASDVSTADPRPLPSRAEIRFATSVVPSLIVAAPATARKLAAAARELPFSEDGASYEPPKRCYPGHCVQAILAAQPAPLAPPSRLANLLKPPAGAPRGQPPEPPATPGAELPATPNAALGQVPTLRASQARQPGTRTAPTARTKPDTYPPKPAAGQSKAAARPATKKAFTTAANPSTQRTVTSAGKTRSGEKSSRQARSEPSPGQSMSRSGGDKTATRQGKARGSSIAGKEKGGYSLSSGSARRSADVGERSGSDKGVSRSSMERSASPGKSGKGATERGSSKSSGKGKAGGGKDGKDGGKGKGGGQYVGPSPR